MLAQWVTSECAVVDETDATGGAAAKVGARAKRRMESGGVFTARREIQSNGSLLWWDGACKRDLQRRAAGFAHAGGHGGEGRGVVAQVGAFGVALEPAVVAVLVFVHVEYHRGVVPEVCPFAVHFAVASAHFVPVPGVTVYATERRNPNDGQLEKVQRRVDPAATPLPSTHAKMNVSCGFGSPSRL